MIHKMVYSKYRCLRSWCAAFVVFLCSGMLMFAADSQTEEPVLTLEPSCAVPFQDNAVLQQGIKLPVWGTSLPGAKVNVTFDEQVKTTIADKDGKWHWADGRIEGSELIVSAPGVKEPKAVRYAYTTQPLGNLLYNTDGMPVGPFTTCGYDKNSAPDRD